MNNKFSAHIWKEGEWYVSHCIDVDIASQGKTKEEAFANLREELELHFEDSQDIDLVVIEQGRSFLTAKTLLESDLVGMWKDRQDFSDSSTYARELREKAQNR